MPHSPQLLQDLLLLLLASVPIAFIFNRLRLPTIVGFIMTGVLIGPYGLGLIKDVEAIDVLAELGVVLLLFTIGLEFSLRRILEMKRLFLVGGGLQVILTTLLAGLVAYLLGRPIEQTIFFGFLFTLSSTAIVLKSYIDRAEIDAPHGRAGVGILLFQDLSIVPMMLLIPVLAGTRGGSVAGIALTLVIAIGAIALIILAARIIVPYLLHHIVRLRSSELFVISIVVLSLGTSWLTSQLGLSLALGAFIAGIILSESEYSHQIVADFLPFRDVFNSVFFISIGMLLSLSSLAANFPIVMGWVAMLIAGKTLLVLAVVRLLGYSVRVSMMAALGLAQIGEFSFILAKTGVAEGLISTTDYQRFLAASIISMIATPFLIKGAPRLAYAAQAMFAPGSMFEPSVAGSENGKAEMRGHVVIVGFGLNGRNLAKVLRRTGVPYVVLELNAETVRRAREENEPVVYGDATRTEVLSHVGAEYARILVLAISDPAATRHTVSIARQLNPDVHIIVRTRYMAEIEDLRALGADEVIPEEFETSIEIFSRALSEYGIARSIIQRQIAAIRNEGYQMFRMPSLPIEDLNEIAGVLKSASTETVFIEDTSSSIGKTIADLELRTRTGVSIIAITRDGQTQINPQPDNKLQAGDILVLLGGAEQIDRAIEEIG
jgi:monovalent cation:H+ antiporter-2, CPA2 family